MAMGASGLVAGPLTTEPSLMLNLLPWHGQLMVPPETVLTMQPWCVHTAVNALNDPACGCVITMFGPSMILPPPFGTSEVLVRALAAGALPVDAPPVDAPPVDALPVDAPPLVTAGEASPPEVAAPPVAGGGPKNPPLLLASYVVHPVSIAAHVTPAPISSARRLCGS